jgi:hypothetical protein
MTLGTGRGSHRCPAEEQTQVHRRWRGDGEGRGYPLEVDARGGRKSSIGVMWCAVV